MSNSDVYLPSASFTMSCDTSYSSSEEEMEVASTAQPLHQTKISTKTDEEVFSPVVFRSRFEKNSRY